MFVRKNDELVGSFAPEYATVLRDLVGQTSTLLKHPVDRSDPGVARLFPDAYPDAGDSAEFRRLTESELRAGKLSAAERMLATMPADGGEVRLDEEDAGCWLRALNDVRLLLGSRLQLTDDTDVDAELSAAVASDAGSARVGQLASYGLLTVVQDSLVLALARW